MRLYVSLIRLIWQWDWETRVPIEFQPSVSSVSFGP